MSYQKIKSVASKNNQDDFIDLVIGGGCDKNAPDNSYKSLSKTDCLSLTTTPDCNGPRVSCGSTSSCGFLGHRESCQDNQEGMCKSTYMGSGRLRDYPDGGDNNVTETNNRLNKTCRYNKDICGTFDNYKLFAEFNSLQPKGSISTQDIDKCTEHFCSLPPTEGECMDDPENAGTPLKTCSRFATKGVEGEICNKWWARKSNDKRDEMITNICNNNPGFGDCACANRFSDPTYALVDDAMSSINDGCWWKKCKQTTKYLIPSDLIPEPGECPTEFCQQIIDVDRTGGDVTISDLNTNIQCNFDDDVVVDDVVVDDKVVDDKVVVVDDVKKQETIIKILLAIIGLTVLILIISMF
jgi:hypothetical protein